MFPWGDWLTSSVEKKILSIGFVLFSLNGFLCAIAPNINFLLLFRGLQGIGGGMIFGTGMAILTSVFPPQKRGQVLGIAVSSVYIGLLTGPFLGGLLTHYWGWRSLFFAISILGTLPILMLFFTLKGEWADAAGESYDWLGAIFYTFALVAIIYGFSALPNVSGTLIFCSGCAFLIAFVKRQMKIREPLFQINLFTRNRLFAFSCCAALIHYSATFALTFLLSFYLQYIQGLDARMAGMVLMAQPIMMALISPLAGRLSDRIEPRIISSIGMIITCMGLIYFCFLQQETSLYAVVGVLMFLGFGFALFSSPNMNAIMGAVDRRYLGVASGSAGTMRVLGQTFSMGIATLVLSLFVGDRTISPELYPDLLRSISWSFAIFSALCVCGIYASLVRGDIHTRR